MRTQVGIIGAGPAGLFLSHLLHRANIECVVLETCSRTHLESRVRAGVLEHSTIELMEALGLDGRLKQLGMVDNGLDMRFRGKTIHLDLPGLTGRSVMIYGQQEIVKDLIAARLAAGEPLLFESRVTALLNSEGDRPILQYRDARNDTDRTLECDFIAGCDGFHGISRGYVPAAVAQTYECAYDFAWLGVLAHAPPIADMTYSNSDRGFALCSRRSMAVSRLYLQVAADERIAEWPDARFWNELHARMYDNAGTEIVEGEIFQRDIAHLRAFVMSPMQHGRLFLAGDAAHIVPPTGAKGLNLAVADARNLARALTEYNRTNSLDGMHRFTERCLNRVWKTVQFSTMLTELLHVMPSHTPLQRELQLARLEYVAGSPAARTSIAEQYVGLFDGDPA